MIRASALWARAKTVATHPVRVPLRLAQAISLAVYITTPFIVYRFGTYLLGDNGRGHLVTTMMTGVMSVLAALSSIAVVYIERIAARIDVYRRERRIEASPGTRLVRPPGTRLARFVDFFFSPHTRDHVLGQPLIDMQLEHIAALAQGRTIKARWVVFRGYAVFWTHVLAMIPRSIIAKAFKEIIKP